MKSVLVVFFALLIAGAWSVMTGGFRDVDFEDAGMRNALEVAVNKHNIAKNDVFRNDVVEVVKAQSQLVSGLKYVITVKLARTNCRKNRANEVCATTGEPYLCTFTVWSRPWLRDIRVLDETCP
ncbi:cystatin C (amyloid angiopathy and cerebral hemorrhage) [Boleophthalmus pectinirostris]|uniref:cystatin C (amyloid angiopathy and cerebral hemorrhage) n=1 Tax=Boleophthalmus pectinirostris TaxID=150288 RepID=UPI000A1C529C|nr:cystatin C (amyloid angiopathy and cerebral hemorrhage) [Boleophthalmus pectinirostris]